MLPELVLDKEDYEEIMVQARSMINSLYPEWTDFNYHDPGITLIELFSWMKEGQQYFLDQISGESRDRFLKLLGIRRRTKRPASALVKVTPPEDITVLAGTKLYAGEICFEVQQRKQLIQDDVICCFAAGDQLLQWAGREQLKAGYDLQIRMFGEQPKKGRSFYIGFSHPLPRQEQMEIYIKLFTDYEVKRNPLSGPLPYPLAAIRLQYFRGGAWQDAESFDDETNGLIESGRILFRLIEKMEETELFGNRGFFLRLRLARESYDLVPILSHLSTNQMLLSQRDQIIEEVCQKEFEQAEDSVICTIDTMMALNGRNELYLIDQESYWRVADFVKEPDFDTGRSRFRFTIPAAGNHFDEIRVVSTMAEHTGQKLLAKGNGFPDQIYPLTGPEVEFESFQLIVNEGSCPERFIRWTKVADFSQSGPQDRHYLLDSRKGQVKFGDCIRGMAPKGEILITSYAKTLGQKGNVKAYKINHFEGMEPQDIPVFNQENGFGGVNEESQDESFMRARRMLRHSETAVSDSDYERYVMATPGLMLESCKVIPPALMEQLKNNVDETAVNIVVKPFSAGRETRLSDCYRKNILFYLEPYRMIGRKVKLLSPQFVTFDLYVDIVLCSHYLDAEQKVQRTLTEYFDRISNKFGVTIQYSELYGMIDMLDCVSGIHSLSLDVSGTGVLRSKDGTIKLPPNGGVRLGETHYLFSNDEV